MHKMTSLEILQVIFRGYHTDVFISAPTGISSPSIDICLRPRDEVEGWCRPRARPVSESESERQRARNGASESERDFSRERATIHTSESKRAKFRIGRDFSFYSALQWSSYVCSIYKTYGNPVSVRFPLFQHQHSTNIGCFCGVTRCLRNQIYSLPDWSC